MKGLQLDPNRSRTDRLCTWDPQGWHTTASVTPECLTRVLLASSFEGMTLTPSILLTFSIPGNVFLPLNDMGSEARLGFSFFELLAITSGGDPGRPGRGTWTKLRLLHAQKGQGHMHTVAGTQLENERRGCVGVGVLFQGAGPVAR